MTIEKAIIILGHLFEGWIIFWGLCLKFDQNIVRRESYSTREHPRMGDVKQEKKEQPT